MSRILALLLAAAACTPPPVPPPAPKPAATLASRKPKREDLVCFPCHSLLKFEKGPPFPHSLAAHRAACLACHETGSPELTILAAGESGR